MRRKPRPGYDLRLQSGRRDINRRELQQFLRAGTFSYVLDPVLEGTTSGVLTVVFGQPISFVSFGLAVNTFDTGIAATVRLLFEDGTDLSTIQRFDNLVEVEPIQAFSEGKFSIPSIPEPGLGSLTAAGLVALALQARRRRRSRF